MSRGDQALLLWYWYYTKTNNATNCTLPRNSRSLFAWVLGEGWGAQRSSNLCPGTRSCTCRFLCHTLLPCGIVQSQRNPSASCRYKNHLHPHQPKRAKSGTRGDSFSLVRCCHCHQEPRECTAFHRPRECTVWDLGQVKDLVLGQVKDLASEYEEDSQDQGGRKGGHRKGGHHHCC